MTTSKAPSGLFRLFLLLGAAFVLTTAAAQRQMEHLGRGVIAIKDKSSHVFVSWRLLGTDPDEIAFNVYRSVKARTPLRLKATRGMPYRDRARDSAVRRPTERLRGVVVRSTRTSGGWSPRCAQCVDAHGRGSGARTGVDTLRRDDEEVGSRQFAERDSFQVVPYPIRPSAFRDPNSPTISKSPSTMRRE